MKELEAIKGFTKWIERKFDELEKAVIGLSELRVSNCNRSSFLTVDFLKKIFWLEKMQSQILCWNKENHGSSLTETDSTKNVKELLAQTGSISEV